MPLVNASTGRDTILKIGFSHRKTVQLQFTGSIPGQLLYRDQLAHRAGSLRAILVARLSALSRWPDCSPGSIGRFCHLPSELCTAARPVAGYREFVQRIVCFVQAPTTRGLVASCLSRAGTGRTAKKPRALRTRPIDLPGLPICDASPADHMSGGRDAAREKPGRKR